MTRKKYIFEKLIGLIAGVFLGILIMDMPVNAAVGSIPIEGKYYENPSNGTYSIVHSYETEQFSYGKKSIGKLYISGDISPKNYVGDTASYPVNDNVSIYYLYDDSYRTDNEEEWNLYSSDSKQVHNVELPQKAEYGVIIVQTSLDGVNWENETATGNVFCESTTHNKVLWETNNDEIKQGTYFRVLVAYTMRKLITTDGGIEVFGDKWFSDKKYYYASFVETYTFHVCNEKNYVLIRDVMNREKIGSGSSISYGFYIDNQDSTDTITVKHGNNIFHNVKQYARFTDTGKYTVEIANKHNKKRYYNVEVTKGIESTEIEPKVYRSNVNTGFKQNNLVDANKIYGIESHTKIMIGQNAGTKPVQGTYKGFNAYGVEGTDASIFIKFNTFDYFGSSYWDVTYSEYGKNEGETFNGIKTGEVGAGVVVVQTSETGETNDWHNIERRKYENGLFNTDIENNYERENDILLYRPSGDAISKGVFIRVLYAYQAANLNGEEVYDFCEKYEFYLCGSSLDAITFYNQSITKDTYNTTYGDADSNSIALVKQGQTLLNNSCTVTGFKINNSSNKTIEISVKRNNSDISLPERMQFNDTGKYDIHLVNRFGDTKDVTIYIDKSSSDEALRKYFGKEGFIRGKRIYAENDYPVYEAENVTYNIEKISEYSLPIYGVITNSNGKKTELSPTRSKNSVTIFAPGDYTVELKTGIDKNNVSGDIRTFTFKFRIIAKGTAPGPQNNKKQLYEKYAYNSMVDSYPVFYAVSYQCASGKLITLAFKERKNAVEYAAQYENGVVEKISENLYQYKGTLMHVGEKLRFDENQMMDLADVMYAFAEQAVYEKCFDMSDNTTYMTLPQEIIDETKNLRTLELCRSVTIYAENQKASLTELNTIPLISDKPMAFCFKGIRTQIGKDNFKFVKDKYGCDSYSVVIKDKNNKEYPIQYMSAVGKQLMDFNCPSGVVTITEKTYWGDETSYKALFIRSDEITTSVKLQYTENDKENEIIVSEKTIPKIIKTKALKITGIEDDWDDYAFVRIEKNGNDEAFYVKGQANDMLIEETGLYHVFVLNRLGSGFDFEVEVTGE